MNQALITQLKILRLSNIKPNFSELARLYDMDRRTVKKYYDGYKGKPTHHNKPSRLDKHKDIIVQKLAIKGDNVRAVYEYIISEASKHVPVVEHGIFGADMKVSLENDGPFTVIFDENLRG